MSRRVATDSPPSSREGTTRCGIEKKKKLQRNNSEKGMVWESRQSIDVEQEVAPNLCPSVHYLRSLRSCIETNAL